MIKAIIVDDHALFRLGLKAALAGTFDINVVGEADSAAALFRLLDKTEADIILLDVMLPDMNGADITRRLHSDFPLMKILAISAENTLETVKALINEGIDGFISKSAGNADEIAEAIRMIMKGMEYFGKDIASIIYEIYTSKMHAAAVTSEFTVREREILSMCTQGLLCKEIAQRLGISIRTVETHKHNIFRKLGINNSTELIQYCFSKGIL